MPKDANGGGYWQKVMKNHKGDADVLEEMGKAYLDADNVNDAVVCFEKAIKIDPCKVLPVYGPQHISHMGRVVCGDNFKLFQKEIAFVVTPL